MKRRNSGRILGALLLVLAVVVTLVCYLLIPNPLSAKVSDLDRSEAFVFTKNLAPIWNLGDSLDPFTYNETGERNETNLTGEAGLATQTLWGNPPTSKAIIDKVKAAGFRTVRIPVTWHAHLGNAPEYRVDSDWMARVKTVVDYAYGNGMFVMLDVHHDDNDKAWLIPDKQHEEAVRQEFEALWKQIALAFQGYGERLLFEGANEPRVVGSWTEWAGGKNSTRAVVNRLNQLFVDTVRATGRGNTARYLVVPTYAASADWVALQGMAVPEDARVIASVHAYYPREFASETSEQTHWDAAKYEPLLEKKIGSIAKRFTHKGYPVLIGEFGAFEKNNADDRAEFARAFVKTAEQYDIPCGWWDNGIFPDDWDYPDSFALLDRWKLEWKYPQIVQALTGINPTE